MAIYETAPANAGAQGGKTAALKPALEREMARAGRYDRPLSVIAIVAKVQNADASLAAQLSQHIERRLNAVAPDVFRTVDFWGRAPKGGFIVVLPETDKAGARGAVARLTQADILSGLADTVRGPLRMFVSHVEYADVHCTPQDLIDAAIEAAVRQETKPN